MANHPQAAKRNRQRIVRQARNRHFRSTMRTQVKYVRKAIQDQDRDAARAALAVAVPVIDRCAQRSVIPRGRASRLVSRLTVAVDKLGS